MAFTYAFYVFYSLWTYLFHLRILSLVFPAAADVGWHCPPNRFKSLRNMEQ